MRALQQIGALTALAIFGIVGCEGGNTTESTITETDFLSQFEEIYCGAHDNCLPDEECPLMSSVLSTTCAYDATFAHDCLAGDYTCDDSGGDGAERIVVPTTCGGVYDCESTGGGGGDDDDDDNGSTSYPTPTGSSEPSL